MLKNNCWCSINAFLLKSLLSCFLIKQSWFSLNFYESLCFRVRTGFAQPLISNQTFWTSFAKSSIFVGNETIRAALTWTIKIHYFMRFTFWAGGPFTIWEWSLGTCYTFTIDIDNIIQCWTRLTFSPIRPLCWYSEFLDHSFY